MADLIFPLDCGRTSWNTTKKQSWSIDEYVSASGERKALVQQTYPSWSFNVDFPNLTKQDVDTLMGFYAQCCGSWRPFFFKVYDECFVADKKLEAVSSGVYQATIPMGGYEEPAHHIDNVVVYINNKKSKKFSVNGGLITVTATGKNVSFDYDYYWRVVFDNNISVKQKFWDLYSASFTLKVAR